MDIPIRYYNCTEDYTALLGRLDIVLSEQECPVWMLGNVYRMLLVKEERHLVNKIKEYEEMYD